MRLARPAEVVRAILTSDLLFPCLSDVPLGRLRSRRRQTAPPPGNAAIVETIASSRKKESEELLEARLLRRKRRWVPRFIEERERRWIPYSPRELAEGIVNVFRPRRTVPLGPEPLDEFGLPLSWRHDEVDEAMLEDSEAHLGLFERWCESNDRRAFPADADTCLDFLRANWDRGPELYETWRAMDARHEAYYWHSGANAVGRMKAFLGLVVRSDGTILPGGPEDF